MKITSSKTLPKVCCACLKQITDKSQLICLDTGESAEENNVLRNLVALVPELLPNDVVSTNPVICMDCSADVESALKFKTKCSRKGISSQNGEDVPPISIADSGPGELFILIPSSYSPHNPEGIELADLNLPPGYNETASAFFGHQMEDPQHHAMMASASNQNGPPMYLHLQVVRNTSENSDGESTILITMRSASNSNQEEIGESSEVNNNGNNENVDLD